jgi:hypothetical protein
VVIAPGDEEAVVHVAVRGDTAIEPDETLTVSLSQPENATLGDASAPLTIADDEPLALSVSSPEVDEGEPATFTVALGGSVGRQDRTDGLVLGEPREAVARGRQARPDHRQGQGPGKPLGRARAARAAKEVRKARRRAR